MIVIIDGYNLLKYIYRESFIEEALLEKFIKELSIYSRRKSHYIILVLDGGIYHRSNVELTSWGKLIFSGISQSADDYIKKYLEQCINLNNNETIIVSADKEICKFASKFNIVCIQPKLFYQKFKSSTVSDCLFKETYGKAKKFNGHIENLELDILMQEGSRILCYKDELNSIDKSFQREQLKNVNKSEKKIKALIKRL